jgi:vacuolar-type H+-ATPase subunit E/Vma4
MNLNSRIENNGLVLGTNKPLEEIDRIAFEALQNTEKEIQDEYPNALKIIRATEGLSRQTNLVSHRLNSNKNLDAIDRLLLSREAIYSAVIQLAKEKDKVIDVDSLYESVLDQVRDLPRKKFLLKLAASVFDKQLINLNTITSQTRIKRLVDLIVRGNISLKSGELIPSFMKLFETFKKEGNIPEYVEQYLEKTKSSNVHRPVVKQVMIDYLIKLNLPIDSENEVQDFSQSIYSPYLAIAYQEAINSVKPPNTNDPLDIAFCNGIIPKSNFVVDTFDEVEHQGIIQDNIRAAGMLDYIYYIGECLHVFDATNLLILKWATGVLDIPEGETAQKLYRFHKRRENRSSPEERAIFYKRVLNKGDGQVLQNMVVNEAFPIYWEQLMVEVVQYIQKSENKSHWDSLNNNGVSKARLYQLTRNLQQNLTEHMTGMAHLQVQEDYAHLREAIEIIKSEEIRNYFGGRRQSLWDIIERIVKEEFGVPIQTQAIKTLAIQGNKIFEWIAQFDEETVTGEQFNEFRKAAEAWIIAQASLSSGQLALAPSSRLSAHSQTTPSNNGRGLAGAGSVDNDFDDW